MPSLLTRYGSKKSSLWWLADYAKWSCGLYQTYKVINWHDVNRVLFICKGNICRSAYASALAKQTVLGQTFTIDSCGLDTTAGQPADGRAIAVASKRGIKLQDHLTKTIDQIEIGRSDLLLLMEPRHRKMLVARGPKTHAQHSFLSLWAGQPALLPDPFGTADDVFERCFTTIDKALTHLCLDYENKNG